MKKIIIWCFVISFILVNQTGIAFGASENENLSKFSLVASYIKFDGIEGESKDVNHKGWFDLISFKHKKANRVNQVETITFVKERDQSTPILMSAFKDKVVFSNVFLDVVSSPSTYLRYELKNVMVTSFRKNIANNNISFTLNFEKVEFKKNETDRAGNTKSTLLYEWEAPKQKR